jgi:hypothetical protein
MGYTGVALTAAKVRKPAERKSSASVGAAAPSRDTFVITPWSRGCVAVMSAACEGRVAFVCEKQSSNRTPRAASASSTGVWSPAVPGAHPR